METREDLLARREELARAVENTRDPDAFPGSRQWLAHNQAEKALLAFDLINPHIIAELRRAAGDTTPVKDPWEV